MMGTAVYVSCIVAVLSLWVWALSRIYELEGDIQDAREAVEHYRQIVAGLMEENAKSTRQKPQNEYIIPRRLQ